MSIFCSFQSFVWSYGGHATVSQRVPFVVDISKATFEQLDELLSEVCEGMDGHTDWPPPQEKECMAVAGLNLLNLQVRCSHAVKKQAEPIIVFYSW